MVSEILWCQQNPLWARDFADNLCWQVAPSASRLLLADDKSLALGTLSAPVAKYIRELEVENANAKRRLDDMENSEIKDLGKDAGQFDVGNFI